MPQSKNQRRELKEEEEAYALYLEYIHLSNSPYWIEQNKKLKAIRSAYKTRVIEFRTFRAMRNQLKRQEN